MPRAEVAGAVPEDRPAPEFPQPQTLAVEAIYFTITGAILWVLTNQHIAGQDMTAAVKGAAHWESKSLGVNLRTYG